MAWGNMMSCFSLPNFRAIFQGRVRQAGMHTHTIKSHGAKIARDHLHDWLILVLLVVIEVILYVMHPFYRFVGKDMMTDLKYPLKENTVPVWTVPLFDRWGNVLCHGKGSDVKEGHKSFPSGHTSWSFAGLGFLSLYLSGKIKAFDRKGHVAKLCIVFLPLLAASLVAISRVDDYWHHWQDVFAGGLLGLVVAAFCYAQFFPPPYNDDGWGPYAYFRALEESRSNTNAGQTMNALNVQPVNVLVTSQQGRQNGDDLAPLEELESGRM
ncbi:hypothetical protein SADUNF_Sadunf10G0087700 [Salix dunnii]|uniref:Phosphatidic acid phosphatase type 2/haloperoxidase domain-containing protein n=1 Tax=Salix dunnii TaxID=1413687 RepID=A0A835JR24_9ROSI|nr:hypothetical protein SADUNF_Sadunf10G0087700 [Salix dunnii]